MGVEEDDDKIGIPTELRPLEDRSLVGRAEDMIIGVRSRVIVTSN